MTILKDAINKHFIHIGLILYPDAKGKKRSFIAYSDIHSMRRTNEIRDTEIRIRSKFQTTLLFRAGNKSHKYRCSGARPTVVI